jgi:hypothetical protein
MRAFPAVILSLALASSQALAVENQGALPAGKPAGVKQADLATPGFLIFAGIAVVAAGIAIAVSNGNGSGTPAVSTTSTTSP